MRLKGIRTLLTSWGALASVGLFLAGAATGFVLTSSITGRLSEKKDGYSIHLGRRGMLNPLLDFEIGRSRVGKGLRPFKHGLKKLVSGYKSGGKAEEISIYFRDLDNGPWIGIGENKKFTPASLWKVPILIACYQAAEEDPSLLERRVPYEGGEDGNAVAYFKPKDPIVPGRVYTVDDLIYRMIVGSDNNATCLLVDTLGSDKLFDVLRDFGMTDEQLLSPEDSLSVRLYGSFMRVLYNSSYLDRRMSERALSLLAQTEFEDGLVAGVSPGTVVAHKFGSRLNEDRQDSPRQLHDCGIIYHPRGKTYLLCVMTKGKDFDELAEVIAGVSRFVYKEIDQQFGGS